MGEDLKRLRDAADAARTIADWLESTAKNAGYTERGVDLGRAHRVADVILGQQIPAAGAPEPVQHAEQLDAHGRPTGHALCGADGGLIAVTGWRVDCEACLNWDDREQAAEAEPASSASPGGWDDAWSREQHAEADDPANWQRDAESGAAR